MTVHITDLNAICCVDYGMHHFIKETHYHQSTAMITFALELLAAKHQNIALGKMCKYYSVQGTMHCFPPYIVHRMYVLQF